MELTNRKIRRDKKIAIMEQLDLEALKPHHINLTNPDVQIMVLIDKEREKVFLSRVVAKS